MENVHATIVSIKEALELVTWASSQDSDSDENPAKSQLCLFLKSRCALSCCRWNYFHDADEL